MSAPVVIVGSGLAGYNVAKEFRKHDSVTPLLLLTADGGEFYSKPMLSNALSRNMTPAQLASAGPEQMADQLAAEIRVHMAVTRIDVADHRVHAGDLTFDYSRLVLAIGASQVPLPAGGDARDAVLSVNSLDDYARFHAAIGPARRIAVIGPGLIGCEFANDLCLGGRSVAVIGPDATPLGRLLPPRAGALLKSELSAVGVEWHLGASVSVVMHAGDAYRLILDDGQEVVADVVLSAIGLRPNIGLAQQAGLRTGRGIMVDSFLRTSASDVHAIGDCAEIGGMVLPFVMPIMIGARALGRTLAGEPTAVQYPAMPVHVKTTSHPVVVCPAPPGAEGAWDEVRLDNGVRALFRSAEGRLLGFALTGTAVTEQQRLVAELARLPQ